MDNFNTLIRDLSESLETSAVGGPENYSGTGSQARPDANAHPHSTTHYDVREGHPGKTAAGVKGGGAGNGRSNPSSTGVEGDDSSLELVVDTLLRGAFGAMEDKTEMSKSQIAEAMVSFAMKRLVDIVENMPDLSKEKTVIPYKVLREAMVYAGADSEKTKKVMTYAKGSMAENGMYHNDMGKCMDHGGLDKSQKSRASEYMGRHMKSSSY